MKSGKNWVRLFLKDGFQKDCNIRREDSSGLKEESQMFDAFSYDGRVRCTSVVDACAVGIMINSAICT
jgi:hypothetical protein